MSEIVDKVLSDPEALWAVMISGKKVVGPWEKAESKERRVYHSKGSEWRLLPEGNDLAIVYTSQKIREPDPGDYSLLDEEHFDYDMEIYREKLAAWKPWTYSVSSGSFVSSMFDSRGYAETKEEAKSIADQILRENGVLLRGG